MNALPFISMFNGKTRITLIHAATGKVIGIHKMKPEQLPLSFNKPFYIELEGTVWRVMRAEPVHAKEFTIDNKLTLHVLEAGLLDPDAVGADVPTICDEWPELAMEPIFTDFFLDIKKDRWRQLELLSTTLLPHIQEEMVQVEAILFPGEHINTLAGYKNIYIRKNVLSGPFIISLNEFCKHLSIREKGGLQFCGDGFVQNGFALRSDNYTYYGIVKNAMIEELCLDNFESVDEEFCQVASSYDLVLADWCNGRVIMV